MRRSERIGGATLTDDFTQLTRNAEAATHVEIAASQARRRDGAPGAARAEATAASPGPPSSTVSTEEQATCHFLRLPAELRIQILTDVLIESDAIELDKALHPPAIMRVNRQIRSEAIPIFFAHNTFSPFVCTHSALYERQAGRHKEQDLHRSVDTMFRCQMELSRWTAQAKPTDETKSREHMAVCAILEHPLALMRNVDFLGVGGTMHESSIRRDRNWVPSVSVRMGPTPETLSVGDGPADTMHHPQAGCVYTDGWEDSVKTFRGRLDAIAARSGFRGFSLEDLDVVATALRRIPRGSRSSLEWWRNDLFDKMWYCSGRQSIIAWPRV